MNKPFIFREISGGNPGVVQYLAAIGRKVAKGTGRWLPRCGDRRGLQKLLRGDSRLRLSSEAKASGPASASVSTAVLPSEKYRIAASAVTDQNSISQS